MALRELQRRSSLRRAIDIVEKDIAFATPNINILSAANRLLRSSKWRVPVVDHKKHLLGVYTAMDIVVKYYDLRSDNFTVNDFMKREVVYSFFDENILDVISKMRMFSISGLPIIDNHSRVIGLIEKSDIIYELPFDETLVVSDIMTEKPFFVRDITKNDSVDVLRTFSKTSFKRFPVVDNEKKVIGLLHVNTLIKILSSINFDWDKFIKVDANTLVSGNYLLASEDEPISNIIRLMKMKKADTVIVVDKGGALTGIVTESDIMDKAILI